MTSHINFQTCIKIPNPGAIFLQAWCSDGAEATATCFFFLEVWVQAGIDLTSTEALGALCWLQVTLWVRPKTGWSDLGVGFWIPWVSLLFTSDVLSLIRLTSSHSVRASLGLTCVHFTTSHPMPGCILPSCLKHYLVLVTSNETLFQNFCCLLEYE